MTEVPKFPSKNTSDSEPQSEPRPTIKWSTYQIDGSLGATVKLPHGYIHGTLYEDRTPEPYVYIDIINVEDGYQRQGIGSKLLRSLTAGMIERGARSLNAQVLPGNALRTIARVFGEDNVFIYNPNRVDESSFPYEQALESKTDLFIDVNLTAIDTSEWELPERIS